MSVPDDAHVVVVDAETASALAVVQRWGLAFNERDLDRLLALSAPDFELVTPHVSECGHKAVRRLVHLQSYGVAQHVRPRRYHAQGTSVVVDAVIELRWVDSGELAETTREVAVFDVRDGRVSRLLPQPDLASALRAAAQTGRADSNTTSINGGANHAASDRA